MKNNKISLGVVRKANQKMINNGKLNDPNFMDITNVTSREVGGNTCKLLEEKNLLPEHNINGMILINQRIFSKIYY